MSLSIANNEVHNTISESINWLQQEIQNQFNNSKENISFEEKESTLHAVFIEAERKILGEFLSNYDINCPSVEINKKRYKQVVRCKQTYTTAVGPVSVERSLYREKAGEPSICPLELRAGIIERRWSPRAAKQALLVVTQLTPYDAEYLFKEFGAMCPSKSSLDRLPKKLNDRWEVKRKEFEKALRQQFEVPKEAVSAAVSLDGVLIPMQGGVVLPGDSRYEEASCGTLTYYNKEGVALTTRRYGCMPEHKKLTMKEFLFKEVNYALDIRPNLKLVKVADGAKDNWTFLDGELPQGISVLDFYHAAEHLKKAFEITYGIKDIKGQGQYYKYRSILRYDEKGIDKIISHLSYLLKKNPKNKLLKTELNYFKNNRNRCRYTEISQANLPIGSGIVEATCKSLVSQRLKRSGMCWKEKGGQAMLTFRGLYQSGLFDNAWEKLSCEYFSEIQLPKNVVAFPGEYKKTVSS